jgi:hypothetical protein
MILSIQFLLLIINAASSSVVAIRYIVTQNLLLQFTIGNHTRGELVKGYWSLLGANENNFKSYSLLLTIEFLGAKYSAVIKSTESIVVNGQTFKQYRRRFTPN